MQSDAIVATGARHAGRARRRLVAASAVLTFLALSPRARAALLEALKQLLAVVCRRLAGVSQPEVRKDFLHEAPAHQASPISGAGGDAAAGPRYAPRGSAGDGGRPARAEPVRKADLSSLKGDAARFSDFGSVLPQWLGEGLRRGGFDAMKPVQQKVLPLALGGHDVVGVAPTGSGKTLAFLVPGLVHAAGQPSMLRASDGPIVLVLAPTRELAVQIGTVADGLLRPSRENSQGPGPRGGRGGLHSAVLYGGPRRSDQLQTLQFQQSTHLVVATPGRLLDFLRQKAFTLRRVSFFVLDEGDRMLDYGFEPDVAAISAQIRPDRQMMFFSATWPPEVESAAKRLCSKGQTFHRVSATSPGDGSATDASSPGGDQPRRLELPGHSGIALPPREIRQVVEVVGGQHSQWSHNAAMDRKLPMLLRYLEDALGGEMGQTRGKALIFVSTRNAAEELGVAVARYFGLERCGVMHGARKQDQREATLQAFREGRLSALVATDVLGRGVDIAQVSHVVVFDMPGDIETYIHRVGRTGRNGQPGTSIAFFEPQPWYPDLAHELAEVLRACGQDVPEGLAQEERKNMPGSSDWSAWAPSSEASPAGLQAPEQALPTPPPIEGRGSPGLATAEELGAWDAGGARVWGYSANGGVSEQGRLELREKGILRTSWGWGEWALVPAEPHCPPPSRPCPRVPPTGAVGEHKEPSPEQAAAPAQKPAEAETALTAESAKSSRTNLALSWNSVTDIVELDATGMNFELTSRNGRPAHTYKNRTLGRALPGVEL